MAEEKINIPAVPELQGLPESKKHEWRDGYARAFKPAQGRSSRRSSGAAAPRPRARPIASSASVRSPATSRRWRCLIGRSTSTATALGRALKENGELRLVTVDGRK